MAIIFRWEKLFYFHKSRCYNLPYNEKTKERKSVAKVVKFMPSMDDDMKDYHKKIWKHRMAVILKYVIVVGLFVLLFF